MGKIIKMYVDSPEDIRRKYIEICQMQMNVERLQILINKLNLPNKRELKKNIKQEQSINKK